MPDGDANQWTTIGAVAGPILAGASLLWQASERLRRPVLDPWYTLNPMERLERKDGDPPWVVRVGAEVRVINPRPVSLVVEYAELQARVRRRWGRPVRLDRHHNVALIAPTAEDQFSVRHGDLRAPAWFRVRVGLRGRRRPLTSPWNFRGHDVFWNIESRSLGGASVGTGEPFPTVRN